MTTARLSSTIALVVLVPVGMFAGDGAIDVAECLPEFFGVGVVGSQYARSAFENYETPPAVLRDKQGAARVAAKVEELGAVLRWW